jgi:DNA-binding CsgD family transcriptional regulator
MAAVRTAAAGGLLERQGELDALRMAIETARGGTGALVYIEAPAGLGKTELLSAACEEAAAGGVEVLRAQGGHVERDVALGAARQLFAPVAAMPAAQRKALLTGAAALAAGPLGLTAPDADAPPAADPAFADFHGLYWLTANLAARSPLLIAVDDAHWLDPLSLRWLVYLANRLDGVPVAIAAAARPGEPDAPEAELAGLASDRLTRVVRPDPLSGDAAAALVRGALGDGAAADFCRACHEVTAGNPFYLRRLVDQLVADRIDPVAAAAERVRQLGPEAIARSIVWRLAGLPPAAAALAQSVAVLERDAELRLAAALAGLEDAAAAEAADALAGVNVLTAGRPLEFVHPVVRAAVYSDLPASDRARRHAAAARLLRDDGAPPERVAAHLALADPNGDAEVVATLRAAAVAAAGRGATGAAAGYLERALREPPPAEQRADVIVELGRIQARRHDPSAPELLADALALTESRVERARVAHELGLAEMMLGRLVDARATFDRALTELGDADQELATRIEVDLVGAARFDYSAREESRARLARLGSQLGDGEPTGAERLVLANLAFDRVSSFEPHTEAIALAEQALGGGALLDVAGIDAPTVQLPVWTLCYSDAWDAAERETQIVLDEARLRGSSLAFAVASVIEATTQLRRGRVVEAEASARASLAAQPDAAIDAPLAVAVLVEVLVEKGELDEAQAMLDKSGYAGDLPDFPLFTPLQNARGRLKLARQETRAGLDDLLDCGERASKWGRQNGTLVPWRIWASVALDALGEHDRGRTLAQEALDLIEGFGAPRPTGMALRAIGMIDRDASALERSAAELERADARLELAYTLVELGALLRRGGERREARDPLARGADLAERCGATLLADRAATELRATGARPRRRLLTGLESLTASERRVAQMAVSGMTNRDIAQALFVTVKTVETHLGRLYRKLGIHSRAELAEMMAAGDRAD